MSAPREHPQLVRGIEPRTRVYSSYPLVSVLSGPATPVNAARSYAERGTLYASNKGRGFRLFSQLSDDVHHLLGEAAHYRMP